MTGAQAHDPLAGRAGWLRRARSYLRAADPVLARLIDDRPDFDPGAWMTQLPPMDLFGALGHHRITVIHASLTLLARLCGDAFCTGEMRRQELSGSVQRRGRFVEDRVIGLKDVGHPGGDVEGDLDVGGGGLPGEADGVVEENLVRSGLDDQRRQAGQLGEDGADQAGRR